MSDAPQPLPDFADYKLAESVSYLLSRVRSTMGNMVTQETVAELGITSTQASIMFMLASGRGLAAADLAREYGIDASAVNRLEKRGLITRLRSEEDRRVVRLALTDEGHQLATRIPAIFTGVMEKLTAGFTPEEVGFLKSMLRRILVNSGDPSAICLLGLVEKSADKAAG
jgi:DNA-binding MarR family transcriptional regulator